MVNARSDGNAEEKERDLALFLDVNSFLHFKDIDDIDWVAELGTGKLSFHIAPSIFQELEDKRIDYSQPSKIRKRARSQCKKLSEKFDNAGLVARKYKIEYVDFRLKIDFGDYEHLDKNNPDDRMLSSAIAYQRDKQDVSVVVLSNDRLLRTKAAAHDLLAHQFPENLRLKDEPDPLEKQVLELQKELLEHQDSQPKLRVEFENDDEGENESPHILRPRVGADDTDYEGVITRLMSKVPQAMDPTMARIAGTSKAVQDMIRAQAPSNVSMEKYRNECEEYARSLREFNADAVFYLPLTLVVVNEGGVPANRVRIDVHLPETVYFSKNPEKPPREPEVPVPAPLERSFAARYPGLLMPKVWTSESNTGQHELWRFTGEHEAHFELIAPLKHTLCISLSELCVRWLDDEISNFEFKVHILADNLRKPVVQTLKVLPKDL